MLGQEDALRKIELLTKAIDNCVVKEDLTRLYIERAHCHDVLGDLSNSVNDFLTALETAEATSDIVHSRSMVALALVKKDQKEQALYWATIAVDADMLNSEGHFALGLICSFCGILNVAIESLRATLKLKPTHTQAL